MKHSAALVTFLTLVLAAAGAFGASNIDPSAKYAWGENIGWCNFYADGTNGVEVTSDVLSGYVWCENVGWINLGDGTPDTPPHYSNASAADFGVNNDGAGNLSGYGWGENIGWVNFDTSGAGGSQVTIDSNGDFSGYGWGENVGWINMASGYGVSVLNTPPEALDPTIIPPIAGTATDLTLDYTYYDADGDPQANEKTAWYKGGVLQGAYSDVNPLPSSATTVGEQWEGRVRVYDGKEWGAWSGLSDPVTIGSNSAPEARNPSISPSSPGTAADLTLSYTYFDAEGDPKSSEKIAWYKDGVLQPAYNNTNPLPSSATSVGEEWQASARVNDGTNWGAWSALTDGVWIGTNTPPEARSLSIMPSAPQTGNDLTLNYTYYDVEGDPKSSEKIAWYKDGVLQPAYNNMNPLPSSATAKGEQWQASARVKDSTVWGDWSALSDPVTILNTPPVVTSADLDPSSPLTGDDLNVVIGYYDADSDPRADEKVRWYKDGALQSAYDDQTVLSSSETTKGEEWRVHVRANDGEQWGAWSALGAPVTIGNTPPEAQNPNITPTSPGSGDDLRANFTYYDADGDPKTGKKFRWYKDGVLQGAYTLKTLPSSATSTGEQWRTRVRVYDDQTWGLWSPLSAPVTIGAKGAGLDPDGDADGDGIKNVTEGTDDADMDGSANYLDLDSDGDGIPDRTETEEDVDKDGIGNFLDLDSDNDGVSDALEMLYGTDPYDASSTPGLPVASWPLVLALLAAGLLALYPRRRELLR